jgi:protein-disulfide isomerase|uniref:Periplasmic disulfide bond isomerase n=1 Tax=uncultured crenarchaeote 4B7 TaxID=44557 RepID=Q977T4_9ARCH|nr:periplasmic disulfide bond isomerase [uncultured crenarchaeote 4B7]
MANTKKIAVGVVAVILIAAVTISFSSYMSEFDNVQSSPQDEFETISLTQVPILGSQTATVTIVEIGDYQCPACKSWFDNTRQDIIENYVDTGKANLVFIDMPFIGADSVSAAEATYCADDQGMYWDYHVKLYQFQQHENDGWANIDRLTAIAFDLGLDTEKFNECMNSKKYYSQVNLNKQKASTDFGANSTPTFVIVNSSGDIDRLIGPHPYATFEKVLDSML